MKWRNPGNKLLTPVELGQRHVLPGWHGQAGRSLPSHYNSFISKNFVFQPKNPKNRTVKVFAATSSLVCPNFRSQKSCQNPSDGQDSMRAFNRLMMQLASCLGHLKVLESELEPPMESIPTRFRQTLGVRK